MLLPCSRLAPGFCRAALTGIPHARKVGRSSAPDRPGDSLASSSPRAAWATAAYFGLRPGSEAPRRFRRRRTTFGERSSVKSRHL